MKEKIDLTIEMDSDLYRQASRVCDELGTTLEEVCTLFVYETVRLGRFPFELTEEDWDFVRSVGKEAAQNEG